MLVYSNAVAAHWGHHPFIKYQASMGVQQWSAVTARRAG